MGTYRPFSYFAVPLLNQTTGDVTDHFHFSAPLLTKNTGDVVCNVYYIIKYTLNMSHTGFLTYKRT